MELLRFLGNFNNSKSYVWIECHQRPCQFHVIKQNESIEMKRSKKKIFD